MALKIGFLKEFYERTKQWFWNSTQMKSINWPNNGIAIIGNCNSENCNSMEFEL